MVEINRILLFEDNPDISAQIEASLRSVAPEVEITTVDSNLAKTLLPPESQDGKAYEEVLEGNLVSNYSDLDLIVVDHDLSKLKSNLSESLITAAAHRLAIPVCRYHRRAGIADPISGWELNSNVFAIDVELSLDEIFILKLLEVLDGFKYIRGAYGELDTSYKVKGPATVIANILKQPGIVTHFSLYTSGITFLNDPLIVSASMEKEEGVTERKKILNKRIPYVLSYWLYNSILRFPGIILNENATSSYLNISKEDFEKDVIKDCFGKARYSGPFSGTKLYWWRSILDDEVLEKGLKEYLSDMGYTDEFSTSVCSVSNNTTAGFYDIFTNEPISMSESVGNLSWVPKGADLTRARTDKYDELAPILNL